jgi:3-phosphoshikimate 1-carboxyvinyltransferase
MSITLHPPTTPIQGDIYLPGSKSESNRALILQAMSGGLVRIEGLSLAKDTQTLQRLLQENPENMDVYHAGTAMRFLAAYLAFRPEDKMLTGSSRMLERPIGPLVNALRAMGADIHCIGREGYPPLLIFGKNAKFGASTVVLPGNVSSQFISALLLVAYAQPDGLRIRIQGEVLSRPYIEMTLELMARFGIVHTWEGDTIAIARQQLRAGTYAVEADWSAASYWFCMVALSKGSSIRLHGLRETSLQGDHVVADKMADLGVQAIWQQDVLHLSQTDAVQAHVQWDFADCPDLAQGLITTAAALGVQGSFTGLQSLRIKETDRIAALQIELAKVGMQLMENADQWWLQGRFEAQAASFDTYQDHRMAMAFAPLALACPRITVHNEEVVEKSYPHFWQDLEKVGLLVVAQG